MSDIIHLLPDSVANQIAAGEVIQRPASIIKELVENSLDAGATHIQVVVEDAGKTLVQVIDNGCGMSATDARMSFERHATSKIEQATDLFALQTMGFRGEALASIAAVAQVELRTRTKDAELGTCLTIDGSKVMGQEPVSCPVGANFAVRNLFFNIPARRKFLKSNQTELSNILAEFERIALAHPDKAFTLHSGGSVMMDLPAGNLRRRIVGIFGTRIDKNLVPVDVETTLAHINGFVGMPAAARKKNAHQYLFVNGRFMRHPYFAKAILTAYDRLIPEGQQVPFFLSFKVDPARIDVNIHPTKTEIKFEDDNAIFQILMAAVRESLGKYGAVPAIDFNNDDRFDLPIFNSQPSESQEVAPPQVHINPTSILSNSRTRIPRLMTFRPKRRPQLPTRHSLRKLSLRPFAHLSTSRFPILHQPAVKRKRLLLTGLRHLHQGLLAVRKTNIVLRPLIGRTYITPRSTQHLLHLQMPIHHSSPLIQQLHSSLPKNRLREHFLPPLWVEITRLGLQPTKKTHSCSATFRKKNRKCGHNNPALACTIWDAIL